MCMHVSIYVCTLIKNRESEQTRYIFNFLIIDIFIKNIFPL